MSKRSRERHLAKLAARRQAERDSKRRRRDRTIGAIGVVVAIGLVAVLGLYLFNGNDAEAASPSHAHHEREPGHSPRSPAVESFPPTRGRHASRRSPRSPKMTIDPDKTYMATINTSCGEIVVLLNQKAAPIGVNNFVFLAEKGFYDGLTFHRIVRGLRDPGRRPEGRRHRRPRLRVQDRDHARRHVRQARHPGVREQRSRHQRQSVLHHPQPTPQLDPGPTGSTRSSAGSSRVSTWCARSEPIPGTENPASRGSTACRPRPSTSSR